MRAVFLALVFTGCAYLMPVKPVVVSGITQRGPSWWPWSDKKFVTVAAIAQRRMVVVSLDQSDGVSRFCAEPPPDVVDNVASTLKSALTGAYQGATVSEELSQTLSTIASQLAPRSQGLEFYRAGMFYLCQAWLNDLIDEEEYKRRETELLQAATGLMKQEIPSLRLPMKPVPTVPKPVPPAPPVGIP